MNCAGVPQLIMWGGGRAHEIVSTTESLRADRPRLEEAAQTWHAAAGAVAASARSLERVGDKLSGWEGSAAGSFRQRHGEHLERCARVEAACRALGDALDRMARALGDTHDALVVATEAAGRTVAALAPGDNPAAAGGSAAAMPIVVDAWSTLARELVNNYDRTATEVAADLSRLRPAGRPDA